MRIGVVNNLRAGKNEESVARMLSFLKDHSEVLSVETESAEAMPEVLSEFARQEVDLLVINGGDGTIQNILTEILGNDDFGDRVPMIAPLRAGRTNMSAMDLAAHRDPLSGLEQLIDCAKDGRIAERVEPRRVLRVSYGHGPHTSQRAAQYGMFFGAGIIKRAIELNHRLFDKTGKRAFVEGVPGATLVTAGLIGRLVTGDHSGVLAPDKIEILLDGQPVDTGEFHLVMASTLSRLFARMRPFWGQGPGGVRFTSLAAPCKQFGKAAIGVLRGKPASWATPEVGYTSRNVGHVELRMKCGFTVDGELWQPDSERSIALTAERVVHFVRA
ncbi:MAG: diacylglycerol kinase family protein [Myxococcales bacterium]